MKQYSRRDILKLGVACLPVVSLTLMKWPYTGQEITFVTYEIDENKIFQAVTIVDDSKNMITMHLDTRKAWSAVTLLDDRGQAWATEDGLCWTNGDCIVVIPQ